MPTPNYGYEKRQKELAKKRKKEEKLQRKADIKNGVISEGDGSGEPGDAPEGEGAPTEPTPPAA